MDEQLRDTHSVTDLLLAFRDGDCAAFDRLVPLLYDQLKQMAHAQLRRRRSGGTLSTTALVHEVYLKMADQALLDARDREHFLAISAHAMRQVITDYARHRTAVKRGWSGDPVPLEEVSSPVEQDALWLLDVDRALEHLGSRNERLVRIVECRFFAGYTEEETAAVLDLSLRTVQRDWQRARAWLREELGQEGGGEP